MMTARGAMGRGAGWLQARAPAKINLTLHVLGRRHDGYHALESLVVFAGTGDDLTFWPGDRVDLAVSGPRAGAIGVGADNLVLKAAHALAARVPGLRLGRFHLVKRLPVASGIGGGSADAAAALRLLAAHNGIAPDDARLAAAAQATGADVPVCLASTARMMRGAGEDLGPELDLPPLFAVLVNPGVAVETAAVFRGLGLEPGDGWDGEPHPDLAEATCGVPRARASLQAALAGGRNDLERPAHALAPVIGEALVRLRGTERCWLARMSGSGATVFGLFDDCHAAAAARRAVAAERPDWWVKATVLR